MKSMLKKPSLFSVVILCALGLLTPMASGFKVANADDGFDTASPDQPKDFDTLEAAQSRDKTSSLSYTWEPASGPVDHYSVYVSVGGGPFGMVGRTPSATPAYTFEGADEGATYRFKVQAVDALGNTGPLSDESAPIMVGLVKAASTTSPDRGMAATKAGQYGQAREQFMAALALNPQDASLLYQLAVAEFNLGNTAAARLRLREAHALIEASDITPQQGMDNSVFLHVDGAYNLIPVSRDGWRLQPKGGRLSGAKSQASGTNQDVSPERTYRLDVGSVYQMKLEPTKPPGSKSLIWIPIGLLAVWMFAR